MTTREVSTTETLAENADLVLCDVSGASFTLSLPADPTDGDTYEIVLDTAPGGNTLTVDIDGGVETMQGAGVSADQFTMSTSQWEHVIVTYDASNTRWTKRNLQT